MTTRQHTEQNPVAAWLQQALHCQRNGQPVEAMQLYAAVVRVQHNHWQAHYNLGIVYQTLGRDADARDTYRLVTLLNPQFAPAHNNLGNTLKALGDMAAARQAYQNALTLNPSLAEAAYNVALIQQEAGEFTPSIAFLQSAVTHNPLNDAAWDMLYRTQSILHKLDDAMATFLAWEAAIGQSAALTAAGLGQSRYLGDPVREKHYLKLAVTWPFTSSTPDEIAPVLGMLQYFDVPPNALLQCYQRYDAAVKATQPRLSTRLPRRSAGTKLRVGYVSADFRRHVMGRIMAEILRTHDRDRFEITAVSICAARHHDDVTEAYRQTCDRFIDVASLTTAEAANAIAEADLDVLVDLASHTMAARPLIYAHRPAHAIITHLGGHGCLGMSSVDYKVTDKIADPVGAAEFQIETPLYLDTCLFPFVHLPVNVEVDAQYAKLKPPGRFIFGVFVNILKLSARCLRAWRDILEREPSAMLAFSPFDASEVANIDRVLARAGIALDRRMIIPATVVEAENRGRYAAIDAVLDTFPYAGGDTTLAALDRDIPVVTFTGTRNAERVGVSLLTHVGIPEMIAASETDYIELACKLVRDTAFRARIAAAIGHARLHTLFGDPANHTKALETAYVTLASTETREPAKLSAAEFFREFRAALADTNTAEPRLAVLLEDQPGYVPLLQALAKVALKRGDERAARRYLADLIAQAPRETESVLALASLVLNSAAPAAESELSGLLANLDSVETKSVLAVVKMRVRLLAALGRFSEAESAIKAAVTASPRDIETHLLHANALANLDRADEAMACYQRALILEPRHVAACFNLSKLLADRGHWALAEQLLSRVIDIDPNFETAYLNLASLQRRARKWVALTGLGKVMETRFPQSLGGKLIRAEGYRYDGDLALESKKLVALAETLCALEADHAEVEELAHLILERLPALAFPHELVERLSARYLQALAALYGRRGAHFSEASGGALKIGALVSNLDNAAHTDAIFRALSVFNPGHQQWHLYALDASPVAEFDVLVKKISPDAKGYLLAGMSVDHARARIEHEALDVLIDLTGHRHIAAIPILLHHPARITISNGSLALHTFGLRAYLPDDLDFELFDRATALPAWQARGPDRAMMAVPALLPLAEPARVSATRVTPQDAFVFALTASALQVSQETLQLARAIIARAPTVLLAVEADDEATLQVWQRIGQHVGISANRFVARATPRGTTARFANVDAVLDARPVSDALALADALSTGTLAITMRGPRAAERMGYSVLDAAGLEELVADSGPDFVDIAVKLATDGAWHRAVLSKMLEVNLQPVDSGSGIEALQSALKNSAKSAKPT